MNASFFLPDKKMIKTDAIPGFIWIDKSSDDAKSMRYRAKIDPKLMLFSHGVFLNEETITKNITLGKNIIPNQQAKYL